MESGKEVTFTCTVLKVKPKASLYWRINEELKRDTVTADEDNLDTSWRIWSNFTDTFVGDNAHLECLVAVEGDPDKPLNATESLDVQMYCES